MVSATVDLAQGYSAIPQAFELPPAREFLTSAGFGGALALFAVLLLALVVLGSGWRASKRHREELEQRERQYEESRGEKERANDLAVCEQRFKWVVETAGIEPAANESATLGLGPEVALELLSGLHRDAKRLDDDTLTKAIAVYLNQFALVLAQQGGPLSQLNSGPHGGRENRPSRAAARPPAPASASGQAAETDGAAIADQVSESALESGPAAASPASRSGRRRR